MLCTHLHGGKSDATSMPVYICSWHDNCTLATSLV